MQNLISHPEGHYRFLPGIAPYSCGVIADPGYEMVRVTLLSAQPWQDGFDIIDHFLTRNGRRRTDLCAIELRSPKPFTMEGFIEFNRGYCAVLERWNVFVDGINPIARTNVSPPLYPPATPALHAFSFVRPNSTLARPTFIVAGAGELVEGNLVNQGILRRGDVSPEAMEEKARYVCQVMTDRLHGLGATGRDVSALNLYTIHPPGPLMPMLLDLLPAGQRNGFCWHYTRPPVIDIEFEMDLHGVMTQLLV